MEGVQLLPYDGEAWYYRDWISQEQGNQLMLKLLELPWRSDEIKMFGKNIVTRRKYVWFAEELRPYKYSGIERPAIPFTPEVLDLAQMLGVFCGVQFNSCLANFYPSGRDGMGWHADDEAIIDHPIGIASISVGAPRKFAFKHKLNKKTIGQILEPNSMLLMKGATQGYWNHSVVKETKVSDFRISLTFRVLTPSRGF